MPYTQLLILGASLMPQAQPLSVAEAVAIAEQNAPTLKIAATRVEKARQQAAAARALLGPSLTATGTYQRYQKAPFSSFGGDLDSKTMQVTLSLPLDVAGVNGMVARSAAANVLVAESDLAAERNRLRNQVRTEYFQVVQAMWVMRVREQSLSYNRAALEVARRRWEAGEIARFDVLQFETDTQRAEAALIAAVNQYRIAKNGLNNTMGRPIETDFEPVEVEELPTVSFEAQPYIAAALSTRPELAASASRQIVLRDVRQAERRGLLPSLQLSAIYDRNLGTDSPFSPIDQTTARAVVNVPLYDSGATQARVKAARQDEEQNRLQDEQLRLAIQLDVRQALTRLQSAHEQLVATKKTVELATEALRIARVRYDAGEAIQLEVSSAERALTEARTSEASARYDYLVAYAALQRAVGTDDLPAARAASQEVKD